MFLEYTLQENPSRGGLTGDKLDSCPTGASETRFYPVEERDRQIDPGITVKENITFGMFKRLVEHRGWDPSSLASELREIEEPREFFKRVWDRRHADVIIPYRSVLKFYFDIQRHQRLRNLQKIPLEV